MNLTLGAILACALWLPRIYAVLTKNTLTIDPEFFNYIGIKVTWRGVEKIVFCHFGFKEYVGIGTLADEKLIAAIPLVVLRRRFQKNLDTTGNAILVPPMRGVSIEELKELFTTYYETAMPQKAGAPSEPANAAE